MFFEFKPFNELTLYYKQFNFEYNNLSGEKYTKFNLNVV